MSVSLHRNPFSPGVFVTVGVTLSLCMILYPAQQAVTCLRYHDFFSAP